jgi:hypothetical protein
MDRTTDFLKLREELSLADAALRRARDLVDQGDPRYRFLDSDLREAGNRLHSVQRAIARVPSPRAHDEL